MKIEEQIERVLVPRGSRAESTTHEALSIHDDQIGWYLYLVDMALHDVMKYEPAQGSRVVPVFKQLARTSTC